MDIQELKTGLYEIGEAIMIGSLMMSMNMTNADHKEAVLDATAEIMEHIDSVIQNDEPIAELTEYIAVLESMPHDREIMYNRPYGPDIATEFVLAALHGSVLNDLRNILELASA